MAQKNFPAQTARQVPSIRMLALMMLFIILVPMVTIIAVSAIYQVVRQQESILQEKQTRFHEAVLPVQNELVRVTGVMDNLVNDNIAARSLSIPSPTTQITINAYVIRTALETLFNTSANLDMMMFYCPDTSIMISKDNGFLNLQQENKAQIMTGLKASYIKSVHEGSLENGVWTVEELYGRRFLRCNIDNGEIYCTCLFDLQGILASIAADFEIAQTLFFRQEGQYLAGWAGEYTADGLSDAALPDPNAPESAALLRDTLAGLQIYCQAAASRQVQSVGLFTVFLSCVSIVLVLLLLVLILVWRKRFFTPMNHLMATMETIAEGDMEARAYDPQAGQELQVINTTFNRMLENIQALKIDYYEQELALRQVQLQYYQAQIHPHFYLNCLKNLYSLAQQNETKNMERSIHFLSNHLRYCFQWHAQTVTLRQELEMCLNYIQLMGITAVLAPQLVLDVDDCFLRFPVPPVSLLTFVENSLKYGLNEKQQTVVRITARHLPAEGGSYLQLGVYDNGPGFSDQQLQELNFLLDQQSSECSHVGIRNVLMRFKLIYGEGFDAAFFNQDGGAVELIIRQTPEGEKEGSK